MPMHLGHRLIQLGVRSLGYDPGPIDGWWGPKTDGACSALVEEGPAKSTLWALRTLQSGIEDLGYPVTISGEWDAQTRLALQAVLDFDGDPLASHAPPVILEPEKPRFEPLPHVGEIRQGSAGYVIDTICLHCAAVPGRWHMDKSNGEIASAIHRMHTLPPSKGGRGWSDTGYHGITCPDGEIRAARPITRIGAGARGYNRGVYHLLMIEVGTITDTRQPEDYFTPEALAAAKAKIEEIARQTPITRLMGHREVARKLCPGFEVVDREWTNREVS
ncbi:N-acetylmuramoyl-L-alanine amidase [Roseivivax sp. THAF197b]|uniref:peptidoglycan recognition protein family protein n=1 Tax=Roseivivax sp. THAF197b TaxID=2588299 RepID=UPI00126830C9|nr:N-acetylmuramoyl-L-alanine amidase [Roseivivax sp. THAF197b]QFS83969.1 N-acetylmuramoyl-L-alanine amidase [Roseivivax sp. THAF197b]